MKVRKSKGHSINMLIEGTTESVVPIEGAAVVGFSDSEDMFGVIVSCATGILAQLEIFKTDGFCYEESHWPEATKLLSNLVSEIRGLCGLSLTCNVGYQCCVSSILRHGQTLHTLELRSYNDPWATDRSDLSEDEPSQERAKMVQLNSIRTMCPHTVPLIRLFKLAD